MTCHRVKKPLAHPCFRYKEETGVFLMEQRKKDGRRKVVIMDLEALVPKAAKAYSGQLRREVNAECEKLGKKPIEDDDSDEETEEKTVSATDPDCVWQKGTNENSLGLLREFYPQVRKLPCVAPAALKRNPALLLTPGLVRFLISVLLRSCETLDCPPVALSLTNHYFMKNIYVHFQGPFP